MQFGEFVVGQVNGFEATVFKLDHHCGGIGTILNLHPHKDMSLLLIGDAVAKFGQVAIAQTLAKLA